MQNLLNISEINTQTACRICFFQYGELNSLFDVVGTSELTIAKVLMAFTQTEIVLDENFPTHICNNCTEQTINAFNFKIKVEENEKLLYQYINEKKINKVNNDLVVRSIDIDKNLIPTIKEERIQNPDGNTQNIKTEINDIHVEKQNEIENKNESKFYSENSTTENEENFQTKHLLEIQLLENNEENNKSDIESFSNTNRLKAPIETHNKPKLFDCFDCKEKFESKLRLKIHRSTFHTNKKRRKTTSCNSEIQQSDLPIKMDLSEMHNSLCMPNGPKIIFCKICGDRLNKISFLRKHLAAHKSLGNANMERCMLSKDEILNNEADINSLICGIVEDLEEGRFSKFYSITNQFGNEIRLSDSETESDNDDFDCSNKPKLYLCKLCNKNFDRKYKALYHQKSAHVYEELINQCSYCPKRFISEDLLKNHLKSECENIEKAFKCVECNMKFMWNENLLTHYNIQHSTAAKRVKKKDQPREKSFSCTICNKSFYRQEHLDRHANIHQPDEKKFECPTCHKKFSRKDNMKSHMKIHRQDRDKDETDKHLCVYCGRSFSNSSNLIVHMRRHTGEKPYKCDLCDKGFPRSSDLQCHRRTHTGEKPCLCTICGKGFSRSNKLARHMRIHTGVRPYKCTYCERAFTQSNDLTLHIRRHTGDKPYVCGICGDRFIQGTALQAHRRLKGHFEEGVIEAPFASISVNNPNRMNFANRVDRIGMPANHSTTDVTIEIKPVGRGNSRANLTRNNYKIDEVKKIQSENPVIEIVSTAVNIRNTSTTDSNQTDRHNISNFVQSQVPINSGGAFFHNPNVTFTQIEEGDFFTITNIEC